MKTWINGTISVDNSVSVVDAVQKVIEAGRKAEDNLKNGVCPYCLAKQLDDNKKCEACDSEWNEVLEWIYYQDTPHQEEIDHEAEYDRD